MTVLLTGISGLAKHSNRIIRFWVSDDVISDKRNY